MKAIGLGNQNTLRTNAYQNVRLAFENYNRYGKSFLRYNVCLQRRSMNLVENVANAVEEGIAEEENNGWYDEAKYAQKVGERVNCTVQRSF